MKSALVQLFGFPATLIHGDTLVLDRWQWLKKRLPLAHGAGKTLLDVGCGTGAFTIGAARMGYRSLGLSWDTRNQSVAQQRAAYCKAPNATFEVCDVRNLDQHAELVGQFDVVVCTENIEHILNDTKLMRDMAACMKPGGKLYLTTPNVDYIPMSKGDEGPFYPIEDGGHVRKGYSPEDFRRLCDSAGLVVDEISYCSGVVSQKTTTVIRRLSRASNTLGWAVTFPLRILPPVLDPLLQSSHYPKFSICLVASRSLP